MPPVSMIVPVHNEELVIARKVANTKQLVYPRDKLEVLFVSDGSTDRTDAIIREHAGAEIKMIRTDVRRGKANALNTGLARARHEIIVFSDASIMLAEDALAEIVKGFDDPAIGCISGEDRVDETGGEGAYGRYELGLRNLESRAASIVGASGCFYAQRRNLCRPFREGLAPDFQSVLDVVSEGFRAVTEPKATGQMTAVKDPREEFQRKVRTILRGMTTLVAYRRLLNPFRYGMFAIELLSHKILRWLTGVLLVALLCSNAFVLGKGPYDILLALQVLFYGLALAAWLLGKREQKRVLLRVPFYFCMMHLSALIAWVKYLRGCRQEIWEPSKRP